jgi:hypothetical protein
MYHHPTPPGLTASYQPSSVSTFLLPNLAQAMWWANIKMMMTIAGAGLGLVMLIVWWKCGFAFSHCRSSASA